jgi:hypothetical protein
MPVFTATPTPPALEPAPHASLAEAPPPAPGVGEKPPTRRRAKKVALTVDEDGLATPSF